MWSTLQAWIHYTINYTAELTWTTLIRQKRPDRQIFLRTWKHVSLQTQRASWYGNRRTERTCFLRWGWHLARHYPFRNSYTGWLQFVPRPSDPEPYLCSITHKTQNTRGFFLPPLSISVNKICCIFFWWLLMEIFFFYLLPATQLWHYLLYSILNINYFVQISQRIVKKRDLKT